MKSTKIILAMALATAGLTLPGVAQERPNNQRPTERPKVQRPQERPTERPTERVRGGGTRDGARFGRPGQLDQNGRMAALLREPETDGREGTNLG